MSRSSPLGRFVRIACYSLAAIGLVRLYVHFDSPPTPYEELSKRVEDGWKADDGDETDRRVVPATTEPRGAMASATAGIPWETGLLIVSTMLLVIVGWRAAHSDGRAADRSRRRRESLATGDET